MYELWDSVSLNMIDSFVSAAEVELAVGAILATTGMDSLRPLVLVRETDDGETETVAEGEAIVVAAKRLLTMEKMASPARRFA